MNKAEKINQIQLVKPKEKNHSLESSYEDENIISESNHIIIKTESNDFNNQHSTSIKDLILQPQQQAKPPDLLNGKLDKHDGNILKYLRLFLD